MITDNFKLKALVSQFPNYHNNYIHMPPLFWQVDSLKRQCCILTIECILHNTMRLATGWTTLHLQPPGKVLT